MFSFDTDTTVFALNGLVAAISFWAVLAFVVQNWNTSEHAAMRSLSQNPFVVWLKGDWHLTIANDTKALINAEAVPIYFTIWVTIGVLSCWHVGLVNMLLCLLAVQHQKALTEEINQAIRA